MFIGRENEISFLNEVLTRKHPGPGQLILIYGRRRVGKTSLLRNWTAQAGIPFTFFSAEKEPAALQRRKLYAAVLGVGVSQSPVFSSWVDTWEAIAKVIGDQRRILVFDEFPYAAETDPALLSSLQNTWDQSLQSSNIILVLCGSQIHTMEMLMSHQSPLFGRMTGQWHLLPLPYSSLMQFLPGWSAEERVATYAMVGGVPAYLEWLDPDQSLVQNIRRVVLSPGGMFVAEPMFLLNDELRDPHVYLAIIEAIGEGAHTLRDIAERSLIDSAHLSAYLARLQELALVERRLPALVPRARAHVSRMGRSHLQDAYFRFYFRFLAPHRSSIPFDPVPVLAQIQDGLRAFVGQTAFEELAREWARRESRARGIPFEAEVVGSHWSSKVQVDLVAVNWHTKDILLGECKWTESRIDRQVVRDLVESKTPATLKELPDEGKGWKVHHIFFARNGFTPAAGAEIQAHAGQAIDLKTLDLDLQG
jgi:AAA+ ATPase superfamily predicted ATPase